MGSFHLKGVNVVQENPGDDLATHLAPRPYLHPVRTLGGVILTEAAPLDHPHHLGLSLAFSDVNGTNFWGGSTYTSQGPVVIPNHGRQVASEWDHHDGIAEADVEWFTYGGQQLASERRSYRYQQHSAPATWSFSFNSVIRPAGDVQQLSVSSSAVKGRAGAGYGGIFWRFTAGDSPAHVLCSDGAGVEPAHGSLSPWLMVRTRQQGRDVSVILAQDPKQVRPWFIRTEGYVGAGPAVAWDKPATADRDNPLTLSLHAVIHDGNVATSQHSEELLHQHFHFSNSSDRTT